MRDRGEILGDATFYTDSKTLVPEHPNKLKLLTLEAIVDIRDHLSTSIDVLRSLRDEIHALP